MAVILKTSDLYEQRRHLLANIQLADNKATSLMTIYSKEITKSDDYKELHKLYQKVLFPVVVSSDDKYEPFSTECLCVEGLMAECDTLKEIVEAKYSNISKMMSLITTSLTWLKTSEPVKRKVNLR